MRRVRGGRLRLPCEGLCHCSPYCLARVVGGCGRPAKDGLGLPAFPYCPARVVGGCGRPARDRKDTQWACSALNLYEYRRREWQLAVGLLSFKVIRISTMRVATRIGLAQRWTYTNIVDASGN